MKREYFFATRSALQAALFADIVNMLARKQGNIPQLLHDSPQESRDAEAKHGMTLETYRKGILVRVTVETIPMPEDLE